VKLAANQRRAMEVLSDLAPDNKPVAPEVWKEKCKEFLGKNVNQRFYDMKRALLEKGVIVEAASGFITRRLE
jgi:hypothetical protein